MLWAGEAYAFFGETRARGRGGREFARGHVGHGGEEEGAGLDFDVGLFEGVGEEEVGVGSLLLDDGMAVADYVRGREDQAEGDELGRTKAGIPVNVNPNPKPIPDEDWTTRRYLSYEPHSGQSHFGPLCVRFLFLTAADSRLWSTIAGVHNR